MQIWENVKALGVNRDDEINVHVRAIKMIESRDEEGKVQREAKRKGVK